MLTPSFIYGTAWKQEATRGLVEKAWAAGFRAFDTANQKKHYREDYAGEFLRTVPRGEVWLQSKFTHIDGQDHRLPYDPSDDIPTQVKKSFESTLKHFGTDHLDSFILHGPSSGHGMEDDWDVWAVLEELHGAGKAKLIGVSNVGPRHVMDLLEKAKVKPHVVQNRCYASRGWDKAVRELCVANKIMYQGFSLLTANGHLAGDTRLLAAAQRLDATPAQVIFALSRRIGITPLTGTSDDEHMRQDLAALALELTDAEVAALAPR